MGLKTDLSNSHCETSPADSLASCLGLTYMNVNWDASENDAEERNFSSVSNANVDNINYINVNNVTAYNCNVNNN